MSDRSSRRSGNPSLLRSKGGDQGEIAVVRGSQFEKNSPYDGYWREGICLEVDPRLEECIYSRCLGFPRWGKEHWESCRQRGWKKVYDRRPLVKEILDHLLV